MTGMTKFGAGAIAALALLGAETAQAQALGCVDPRDLSDAVVYTMPSLVDAFQTRCGTTMRGQGFLARDGARFSARFESLADRTWPGAYRVIKSFAAKDADREMMAAFEQLPPDSMRLFVDTIVIQKVAQEIRVQDCTKIDRGVELLSPLPVENVGGLASFLFEMAGVENPSVCPFEAK